ncbi:uncharacterized protein LOC144643886 [Oculina patagonica]
MFGWSPPNILATLVLCLSFLLLFDRSPTQAKPYRKQDILSTYTAGNLGGFNERDWPELVNYKNGHYIERDKRSPTEVEDESLDGNEGKTLSVKPKKRQGIETPIEPLTSDSGLDKGRIPHLNSEENVRSKVDQPESEPVGVPVEEEKKADADSATDSSTTQHQQESTDNTKINKNVNGVQTQQGESDHLKTEDNQENDKADSSSETLNKDQSTVSASVGESKAEESSRPVDENAQVRSVQESNNGNKKLGNVPSDKNAVRFPGSSPLENSQSNSPIADAKANPQGAQTTITNNVNKQVNNDETKITTAKVETPVTTTTSSDQNTAAPAQNNAVSSSAKTLSSPEESAAIHTVPQMQNVPVGPVRDALGNSGSEIVTTRGASDLDSYTERDTEPKPSNGPEVGHFQVDDKSADLEINANSAGVKVKAKPASLQVVSRPGSHSPSAAAQERSLYHHYHYPPYHPHHHWYPGMRRSYGHFHRRHFFHPYQSFPERRGFDSFYDEAPFYRRHMHYWYPHHHRHHFHDSDLYERSRMEEPDNYPKYHGRRRHKRRFRHMNGPYRRQFYNNIPIMNGMESPQMGMTPEEGTMPQLPIGGGIPFTQRQNIITPMPSPINVVGNPPPGVLGGMNAANFAMNEMPGLNNFNEANQMNNFNGLNGIGGINGMNNIGTMGLNSLGQMGNMEGLPGEINGGMEGMGNGGVLPGATRALGARNVNPPSEAPRMAFKKTAILSNTKNKSTTKEHSHAEKLDSKKNASNVNFEKDHNAERKNKGKVNLKSWEKTLKRYHRLNVFTSKAHERHQYRRNAKSSEKLNTKKTDENKKRKHGVSHPHAQRAKDEKGNRKNAIVMHRPPIIYHPPPEIYHRPDIVVHRAPIMLHRPPIIYHQPPVVVHRPAIIYHQPPIVFHQPPPVVHQPILHSHDTWVTKPMVYHTASMVSHAKTYYGIPSHVYSGDYGEGCHGSHCSYRKERVPHSNSSQAKNITHPADHKKKTKRDSFGDYMAYVTSLWKRNRLTKREIDDEWDFITSTDGTKEKLTFRDLNAGVVDKRDTEHKSWSSKVKRETEKERAEESKDGTQKKKKKDVVVNRPPIIYHPPPEIYHRPDIVVHRPPLVIHRPPIIYHQPPVIVHRPAVVYHQPPIVFHQPPPAVSQPLLYSHDSFTVHPSFYASHHGSVVRDFGHYVGVPNVITNYGSPLFGRGPPIGKRSKIENAPSTENATTTNHGNKAKNESSEKAGKKNTVVVSRPPIIYHPPPEIYHRPIIVVHRPPIMIHRAPIFYHQPPVVVHRPAIVYHQPPLIFHQPPPMVHQPVLKSHDTWISHPVVTPYSSRVMHHHTYVGVPDAYTVHHFGGHGHSFYKSQILKHTKSNVEKASERNKITGESNSKKSEGDSAKQDTKQNIASKLKTKKAGSQKGGKKNAVILRRPPVIYHPPPEIYHRPEIVVHRAPIVIHRAPIIYHQPPVIVHRPAVVYHQPPIIFHQPPPVVHQPVFRSHDTYVHRPVVRLYGSRMHHAGHFYHIPHAYFHGHGGIHYMAYGKSKVPQKENIEEEKGDARATVKSAKKDKKLRTDKSDKRARHAKKKHIALTRSRDKTETAIKLHKSHDITYHKAKEVTEKAHKKNSVVIHRPPIIYHPPPEIYHRPDIVVHRAPIVLYRAPIIYHQPPVVVHRPAIVYHQPPIVFHQPPPMVHQPVLHSHDTWVTKPVVIPYASHVRHVATYKGVPHEEIFMHGIGTGAFGKSHVPIRGTRRNKINGVEGKNQTGNEETKTATEFQKPNDQAKDPETPGADDVKQRRASDAKLGAGGRIARALADFLVDKQWDKKPVGAGKRIQRSLTNLLPLLEDQVASTYSNEFHLNPQGFHDIPEEAVGAATRIQRSIDDSYIKLQTDAVATPLGAGARIQRALADPWTSFEDKMSKKGAAEANHKRKRKDAHKKKKDVVVNRPPIIYHPPPEVYHRPDIVVHRAPILIHRPPIVYHQPPVVVHRPAVVYHQPPIVFHQPAPAVNQPLLFSHDNFVVHPMAFASHMGSVVNDAGHYVGLPHGGVSNFPGSIPHGQTGHVFPALNQPNWARRTEVVKPPSEKHVNVNSEKHKINQKRLSELKDGQPESGVRKSAKPRKQKSKHTKGEKKNKVIVARPPMIYHPPPEIYDRPDVIVHRPDIVIHRPSIVYHQPSVVVHRAPVVYQQPPVVFHQPSPMVSQPVYHAHDTYVAHPVFHPHVSHIAHSATYVGAPHFYPGHNDYGWGLSAHVPTAQTPQYDYTAANYGYTPSPAYGYSSYGPAVGRSEVENGKNKKSKKKDEEIHNNDSTLKKDHKARTRRSAKLNKRHFHHHHHHHHHHRHGHHHRGSKRFYHLRPISSFAHRGHRKHVVIIHRPPLIYHPPPQVYRRPDILMHLPPLVYHRPAIMFQQPPTIVHHPSIIYHQPPVVFHNPPPIVHTPIIHSHEMITPHLQHIMVPTSSYVHPVGNYFGPVIPGQAYGKSHIERTDTRKGVTDLEGKGEDQKAKVDEKRETFSTPEAKTDNKGSKKQNVGLVVHQPPIVYHPPPDIFDKPAVVMHPPPMVVHRPPILIHRAPVVVHRPPMIIHRPPIVLHHPTPVYHVAHGHFFHPMHYAMGRSTIGKESPEVSSKDKHSGEEHKDKKNATNVSSENSSTKKGERKNLVLVHRPPMIYHPPPEIYDRPDIIVHRPDIVVHRPSVVYHQPSVVVHRPPIIYHQPPVVFHQPAPMVHQPVMHAHDTYLAHPVPVPYTSQVHHAATYVGAPHFFHQPQFGGYVGHAFGKSDVEGVKSKTVSQKDENQSRKETRSDTKTHSRSTRDTASKSKTNERSSETSRGHKKNKVIIARPPMIYHPPPEIYDRPDVIVHRPDVVIHRPSIVYHQPSVVVHRPPIIYQQPPVVFHQPPPLVHQPIMHAHDTYVAHPVPVPYSSHIQHTSTYVGSPHYYPGGWNYGWSQPHPFGPAYGKSKVPKKNSNSSKHGISKSEHKDKVRRAAKDDQGKNDKEAKPKSAEKSKKKNQVVIHRPPLIYHPPAEVYHKPDVIMHRPDIVIHRPSVVYHQPSVVVHRPPVIYQQPPVVFHQPSPMVRQPVLHAHDTYLAHPSFTPYSSNVYSGGHYMGAPNFYDNGWGWGGHGYDFGHAFSKSEVEKLHKKQKSYLQKGKKELKANRRTLEKEEKDVEDAMRLKNETKTTKKGNKKNLVIMHRPPLIYHPPPEVYHKPDVILHRPDIVIHRPSIVFHQPSVVVHRPPVIYRQPPVVFHQPSPMVHQPILHSHDTYLAHPHFVPFTSHVHHTESYVGAPHFYPGGWGWGDHGYGGFHHAFGKSKVEKASKHQRKSNTEKEKDSEGNKRRLQSTKGIKNNDTSERKKDATKGHKKNLVVMHRPPLIYHPPPEIYDKPDIIVHRPDLVIHRPSVVFHQPSVVVHRPPVIYRQPPVVFHQPSPMVHQPIFHSHETYFAHPHFVPYLSHVTHAGSYVGAPHFYPGHWGPTHGFGHFMGHSFGKSKVEKGSKKGKLETIKKENESVSSNKTKRETTEPKTYQKTKMLKHIFSGVKKREHNKGISEKADKKAVSLHPQKEDKKHHKKGHKKNMVIIQRPNLIYHPPAEIYDRPSIIVHRPDFVIHQPSIVYHQPSVVVHRPPIIYNPPPVVFHQPAPTVHQPMFTAHDMYHSHPQFVPYASHISHAHTYVGAPHYYAGGWGYGYGFSDNSLAQRSGWNGYKGPWSPSPSYGTNYFPSTPIASRRVMRGPYSLAFAKSLVQRHVEKSEDSSKTHENHNKQKHSTQPHRPVRKGERNARSAEPKTSMKSRLHKKRHHNGGGGKKNLVIMRRPPLIYHPPPEVYHKPDVIMHRPDIVIHQPSVVYHQPSVMVHRPPIIYKQPPVVFHQPGPMVNQPIFHAHESYMAHQAFVPYASHIQHTGTYMGAPQFFHGGWNYGYSHAFGKSHVLKHKSKSEKQHKTTEKKTKIESAEGNNLHLQKEKDEKASKKNDIVVSRPPIIYHPPPEIYHRPDIVVHRAPIVLHRPPIIYHQPPVVVHRPAVVYHQPPVVFHQPPPTVNQPILHSHDSFVVRPEARFMPQGSTVTHSTSYVGIPNHVVHGDDFDFHHFHRSHIAHSGKRRSFQKQGRANIAKSTISKMPTTNKENTETTITDQTQKKTLRSTIRHHKLGKRQLMGSHSLYGPVSPINNIHNLHKSIEQREKLSTIPGTASNRQNDVAKRSDESSYDIDKRQIIVPESTENVYRNILPSVYNGLGAPAFQNQAIADSEELPRSDGTSIEHLPDFASSLHNIQELAGAGIARSSFPLALQQYLPNTPKEDSPDIHVHVETTKSSIPLKKREKRQILPIYQQQGPAPMPRVLFQPPSLRDLGVIHAAQPSSVYNLFSQYHPAYQPITDPLHYLQMASQLQHRPHVNINVQSARSSIPNMEHVLEKRSKEPKSKRQLLAVVPPISPGIPLGGLHGLEGARIMQNILPYSPYAPLSRFLFPPMPHLSYPDESEPEETTYPEALPLFHHPAQHIPHVYNTLPGEESNEPPAFNPWASYLSALYNSYLGYPLYHSHHKPRVHVDVQASKSHIPKATKTENKQDVHFHSHISKRQLYNYLPDPSLTSHYALPTAVNYGVPGLPIHRNSPHININVETAKKNGIPSVKVKRRSPKGSHTKHREESKTGDKRDELMEGGENGQEITPNQGNSDFANAPENQFIATSEAGQREDGTTSNNNEQLQGQEEVPQQQPYQEMVGQRQELEQNSVQQSFPSQGQPMMVPFQAQQQALPGRNAPMQIPLQQPVQSDFQTPFQAPLVVPFQGLLPSVLPGASSIPVTEQSNPQQAIQTEEEQPKHTSINVNVAAKSTVPKKKSKKSKNTQHKRQFVASPQGLTPAYGIPIAYNGAAPVPSHPRVSINVQTTKKSAVENDHNKRQSISLLTRFPAMQVLPQTFKQNGILMPAFNTLPINHKIKANGMLLEELQRQRKHKIPKTAKSKTGSKKQTGLKSKSQSKQKENAKKRQFYAVPQSPLAVQQYPEATQLNVHPRPRVSVNVEVNKRKSEFPRKKHHGLLQLKNAKSRVRNFDEPKSKRQVYGMEQLPHMIQNPVVGAPLLSQIPLKNQRPRVSVHVEVAKKKNKLLSQKEPKKEPPKKDRRQIYGLSELPHEGLPFPVASQGQALGYLPSTAHTPRVSVNVETSKRSDEEGLHEAVQKRQVFGLQPPLAQPFEQPQEPVSAINDQEALQSDEQVQGGLPQSPINMQEEPQQDQSPSTALPSNPTEVQQQQTEVLSSDAVPSQAGLSESDYRRPHVSVHVEASRRSKDKPIMDSAKVEKRQLQQSEQEPEDYEPDVDEQETGSNTGDLLQDQRPRVSVKVDVAKKKHHVAAVEKIRNPVKRQFTVPFNGGLNAIQGSPIENTQVMTEKNQEDNEQGVQQVAMLPQSESEVPQQQQQQQPQQQVMQPVALLQPIQQQQQIQPFQPVMLPVAHTVEDKLRPKVSISVQTAKSLISTNNDRVKSLGHHKEQTPEGKSKRQLFGTVPLLSTLGQTTVPGGALKQNGRSTVPQSVKAQNQIQGNRKDRRSWKRQLYNYLGGQQQQQVLPTQTLQSIAEPQQQEATVQPVQALEQDSSVQLTPVNLPQATLLQTNEQEAPQPYLTQPGVIENNPQASLSPLQSQESSVSPLGTFQHPHVSINVQTAKSHVPNPTRRSQLTSGKGRETKKFKRQFDLLGGGVIERRRGPKFAAGPLKKPRGQNLFGLGNNLNNLNKPVEVFTDPISNLVAGGAGGRRRPKLGGIRLDSPTGVGALPLKGTANPLEGTLPPDLGAQAILQDSPAETAAPFAQAPGVGTEPLFRPPSGIAGPQLESLEREGATNFPLPGLPPTGPAVFPLPPINRAFVPNFPVPGAPLPQANPLLLAPRFFPILPLAPPMAVPPMEEPPALQEQAPELPQAPPQLPPMLPPVIPMPVPSTAPAPALPSPDSLFSEPEEDKPSVHVNVETSRSNVPERERHSMQQANGPANRG